MSDKKYPIELTTDQLLTVITALYEAASDFPLGRRCTRETVDEFTSMILLYDILISNWVDAVSSSTDQIPKRQHYEHLKRAKKLREWLRDMEQDFADRYPPAEPDTE